MRHRTLFDQTLIVLWAVMLAFALLLFLGATTFFSHLVGEQHIEIAVDIAFIVLVLVFAALLSSLFPNPKSIFMKIAAFFTPFIVFIAFFWYYA